MGGDEQHIVYRLYGARNRLLYVGCSVDCKTRYQAHYKKPWWPEVTRKEETVYKTRLDARRAEGEAIRAENPVHNVVHRRGLTVETERELSRASRQLDSWLTRRNDLIKKAHADGHSIREIARTAGLSPATVHNILHGRKR